MATGTRKSGAGSGRRRAAASVAEVLGERDLRVGDSTHRADTVGRMTDRSLDLDVGPDDGGSFGLPSSPRAPLEISAVVPVYRSAAILPELYRRLTDALGALADRHEIILVEDCGGDDSWSVIEGLAARDDCVRGIRMSRNYGQHNALLCGIRAARYPIIVTLDDDLQNPPEEIHKLIAALDDGADVVYGTPENEQHGFLRDQSSRITKLALQSAMGAETARNVSAFRAFRTRLRDAFATYRGPYVSIDVLLTWGTTRFSHVTVRHEPRAIGRLQLHVPQAGHPRVQHDDRLQHAAPPDRQRHRLPLHVVRVRDPASTSWSATSTNGGASSRASPSSPRSSRSSAARSCSRSGSSASTSPGCTFASMDRPTYLVREVTGRRMSLRRLSAARGQHGAVARVLARAVGHGDLRVPRGADRADRARRRADAD